MEDEKKLMDEIRELPVDVPESLSPENVTEYLKEHGQELRKKEESRKVIRLRTFLGTAAAVLVAAIAIPTLITVSNSRKVNVNEKYESTVASAELLDSEASVLAAGPELGTAGGAASPENTFDEAGKALIKRSEDAFAEKTGSGQAGGEKAARIPLGNILKKALTYEEVKSALGNYVPYYYEMVYNEAPKGASNAVTDGRDAAAEAPITAEAGAADHSTTNLREANVDEGDVVKTDGRFIYQIKNTSKIRIIRANGASLEEVSMLKPDYSGSGEILDMYLAGDQLVLITYEKSSELSKSEEDSYYVNQKYETHVRTYDLGDRTEPKEIGNVTLEGRYETSRLTGGVVYVVTDKTKDRFYPTFYRYEPYREPNLLDDFFDWIGEYFPPQEDTADSEAAVSESKTEEDTKTESTEAKSDTSFNEEEFLSQGTVPKVNGEYLTVDNIYIPKTYSIARNWLISSVRLSDPAKVTDAQLICTDLSEIYVSSNALFLIGSSEADYEGANVIRVDFADGAIRPTAAAYLPGTVDDSFSVSESGDGHFRAAVTRGWNGTNSVYVFDREMNLTGSLENIIKGEEIKSARYLGDILYLVTYRNTDPLFSVDLSDPTAPKLLGELKIPGFSEYLHPYGDGRLLGLGYETDPKTGETLGTKLALFDISNPANVKELSKLVLRNVEPSVAFENYKSVLADPEKNLFGFTASEAWWTYRWEDDIEYWDAEEAVTDEEAEEASEETLAKEGIKYIEESSTNVAEGLVFDDGTTEAVSAEKKADGGETDADQEKGRTANVQMLSGAAYLLFSVENDEIVCRLVKSLGETEGQSKNYGYFDGQSECRGIYIGDTFYVVEKLITAFDMNDGYKEIGELK